jgi:sugar/nucleoside kinase (ribokinase family)
MDVSLYGHLTFDRIFEDFRKYTAIGSIGNVWNFLLRINPKLKVYINELDDVSFIKDIKGIVSADICKGKELENKNILRDIDYLFISDEDIFTNIKELGKLTKGWVILHHKAGSICTDGDKLFETKVSVIENVNVLGAGDMFAASFINEQLTTSVDLPNIVANSHHKVTSYLETISNEKN